MTYQELKDFCNTLTEDQLKQEVYLSQTDDAAIKIESAVISNEDIYFDHTEELGNLQSVKDDNPDDWEDIIEEATLCPKGTVYLLNE